MSIGIYKITSPANRIYIGQSNNLERRQKDHNNTNKTKQLRKLHHSLLKYGVESHIFEIIEICDIELLNERERYWQDYYNVLGEYGLNCRLTASNDKSAIISEETRKKLSESHLGEIHPEWRNKIKSLAQCGDKHWTRNLGISDEMKKKMSEAQKKLYQNGYKSPQAKPIKQYSLDGKFIRDWDSANQAGRELNLNGDAIRYCVIGKSKTSGGFLWRENYVNNEESIYAEIV